MSALIKFLLCLFVITTTPGRCFYFGEIDEFPRSEVLNEHRHGNVDVVMSEPMEDKDSGDANDANSARRPNIMGYNLGAEEEEEEGDKVSPPGNIMQMEHKRGEDLEGPVKLKVDDKNGLVEEGAYHKDDDEHSKRRRVPKICDDGVPCQRVDSRVTPRVNDKDNDDDDDEGKHRKHS